MPLVSTRGAASAQGFGEFAQATAANYIEDVFSTWLYTGNGTSQTITNGIDLSTKGGLVWTKIRSSASWGHSLIDTVQGLSSNLATEIPDGAYTSFTRITSFNTTGYALGANSYQNENASTFVSWTFRKQPKFFDVVTYTGTGSNTTIAHSLGSVPGSIIVKRTDTTAAWAVYHRSLANTQYLVLNTTAAAATGATWWNSTTPTSSVFSVGTDASVNASGGTYVAYLFAHDAGGFGLTGTDNVISCGGFTADGSGNASVTLGYEPQWIMYKRTDSIGFWVMIDSMRGIPTGSNDASLFANTSGAEATSANRADLTATGFYNDSGTLGAGATYIYIAIRRGPMKVPTLGTSVFAPNYAWDTNTNILGYLGQPTDAFWLGYLSGNAVNVNTRTRLVGGNRLTTSSTASEVVDATTTYWDNQLGFASGGSLTTSLITWNFKRAPSFFDVVCYTGTGSATTFSHNLQAVPELMIVKSRSNTSDWLVYNAPDGPAKTMFLNETYAAGTNNSRWNNTTPTSSVFSVGTGETNQSGYTYVNYLFATCAGVSKVGSYTGTGTTQTINCGFTAGSRFVLIKRTDSTGDWYVWDSERGIIAGNDPYLLLNSTAAEVTGTDYIDTAATGFEISSTAPAAINASAGTFIFLAIA